MKKDRTSDLFQEAWECWRGYRLIRDKADRWNDYDHVVVTSAKMIECELLMLAFASV